jgi:hypothetical protein
MINRSKPLQFQGTLTKLLLEDKRNTNKALLASITLTNLDGGINHVARVINLLIGVNYLWQYTWAAGSSFNGN